jgi:uncharacterized damage-inducible protein DinB
MHLTVRELMSYTAEERGRWERWFRENGDEMLVTPIAGPRETTIGQLVMHIFGAELNFAQRLRYEPVTAYRGLPSGSVDAVFGYGMKSRQTMREFVEGLAQGDWERVLEFAIDEWQPRVTVRKAVCHVYIHEIRHWAQVASLARERGFAPPDEDDLLFSGALE